MTDPQALRAACLGAVLAQGLTPVGELFHRFEPMPGQAGPTGITGVLLLAESHLAVHTWPELGGVTLDVYVCNFGADNSDRAEGLLKALQALFGPSACELHRLHRGGAGGLP